MDIDSTRSFLEATSKHLSDSNTRIIGSCTGMLAAVAASSSRSLPDLLALGVTLVRIAFRVGVAVADSRERMQQGPSCQGSWSVAVAESNQDKMQDLLAQFHTSEVRAETLHRNTLSHRFKLEHFAIKSSIH